MWHTIHMHISILHRKYALYSPTPGEDRALAEQHQRLALDLDRNRYPELYSVLRDLNDVYAKILAEEWGNREFSVGMSLLDEPSVDHERALVALENARNVYAIEVDPLRWARISMELGFIYRTRRIGGVSENLEKAIQFYSDAITVYQRDTHPLEWGRCQSEMGEAIQRLSDGRDPALKERALRYFGLALGVITKADWPEMWHTIHMHISMLHRKYALYSPTPGEDRALAEQHQRLALDLDRNRYPELYSMMIRTFALSEQILGLRCKLQSIESAEGGVSEPAGPNRNTPKLL
jgi:tetratricopeptide (TPR) repeat protein